MKAILSLVGIILIIVGAVVGVMSQKDFGVALIGLNLGLAATLLVGGFIVMGLGSLAGSMSAIAKGLSGQQIPNRAHSTTTSNEPAMSTAAIAGAGVGAAGVAAAGAGIVDRAIDSQYDKAAKGVDDAIDKVALAAEEAKDTAGTMAKDAGETLTDKADEIKDSVADLGENAGDKLADIGAGAKEAASDAAETLEDEGKKADVAVETSIDTVEEAVTETDDADARIDHEAAHDGADKPEDESDELYVVEELVIRGKQARVLSDQTVEAETNEGWMRFENVEHLEEYIDATES